MRRNMATMERGILKKKKWKNLTQSFLSETIKSTLLKFSNHQGRWFRIQNMILFIVILKILFLFFNIIWPNKSKLTMAVKTETKSNLMYLNRNSFKWVFYKYVLKHKKHFISLEAFLIAMAQHSWIFWFF